MQLVLFGISWPVRVSYGFNDNSNRNSCRKHLYKQEVEEEEVVEDDDLNVWKNQKKQNNALTLMPFCNHINANHILFGIDQKQNKTKEKKTKWKTKPTNPSEKFTDKRKKLTINFIFHDDSDDDDADGLCLYFVYITHMH